MIVEALSTLGGGLLGGVLRFAPEVLKFFSSKRDQAHELAMLDREMQFATLRGEQEMRRVDAAMSVAELSAMGEVVLQSWTIEDMSMFSMILSFWFVSRSISK